MITSEDVRAKIDAKEMASGVAAVLVVNTGEPAYTGEATVLDLSDPDNCNIDESGHCVLDRSWMTGYYDEGNMHCAPVIITAEFVTLDMRGFAIDTC